MEPTLRAHGRMVTQPFAYAGRRVEGGCVMLHRPLPAAPPPPPAPRGAAFPLSLAPPAPPPVAPPPAFFVRSSSVRSDPPLLNVVRWVEGGTVSVSSLRALLLGYPAAQVLALACVGPAGAGDAALRRGDVLLCTWALEGGVASKPQTCLVPLAGFNVKPGARPGVALLPRGACDALQRLVGATFSGAAARRALLVAPLAALAAGDAQVAAALGPKGCLAPLLPPPPPPPPAAPKPPAAAAAAAAAAPAPFAAASSAASSSAASSSAAAAAAAAAAPRSSAFSFREAVDYLMRSSPLLAAFRASISGAAPRAFLRSFSGGDKALQDTLLLYEGLVSASEGAARRDRLQDEDATALCLLAEKYLGRAAARPAVAAIASSAGGGTAAAAAAAHLRARRLERAAQECRERRLGGGGEKGAEGVGRAQRRPRAAHEAHGMAVKGLVEPKGARAEEHTAARPAHALVVRTKLAKVGGRRVFALRLVELRCAARALQRGARDDAKNKVRTRALPRVASRARRNKRAPRAEEVGLEAQVVAAAARRVLQPF